VSPGGRGWRPACPQRAYGPATATDASGSRSRTPSSGICGNPTCVSECYGTLDSRDGSTSRVVALGGVQAARGEFLTFAGLLSAWQNVTFFADTAKKVLKKHIPCVYTHTFSRE
jgi:hypothetical protein